jgi:hypothetical protein
MLFNRSLCRPAVEFLTAVFLVSTSIAALADGTETLGPPSITISAGTGLIANGTGMITQPGSITIDVPVGSTINQVLLYWAGSMATNIPGDDTITVSNGSPPVSVTGTLLNTPIAGSGNSTFRADITTLGLISSVGTTTLDLSDMVFTHPNGAGVIVILDDGSTDASIDVRDGSDFAYINYEGSLQTTVPQTFSFKKSNRDQTAQVSLFFGSVSGSASGGSFRPTAIELTTNGPKGEVTVLNNLLDSIAGDEFDSFTISIDLPRNSSELTIQPLSVDNLGTGLLPASFDWLAAGFSLRPDDCGRMTGGGSVFTIGGARVTRGFEIHCDLREPNNIEVNWPDHRFHMTELTSAVCRDTPVIDQTPPPSAPFDTFTGTGAGRLNNQPGARIEFVFVDAGEPGTSDTAAIKIFDKANNLVLDVPGNPLPGLLRNGNLQTHKDNKCVVN